MRHILRKLREIGLKNFVIGFFRRHKLKKMQSQYHIDDCHTSPYEYRMYLQWVANYINKKGAKRVVDIGCGIGDLLRHIKSVERYGYDYSEGAIKIADLLSDDSIKFYVGSFDEMENKGEIDYLITLGFMHGGSDDMWKPVYTKAAQQYDIKRFVVDVVPEDGETHHINFKNVIPETYSLVESAGPFLGGRMIEIYERNDKIS